jgi:hypothetical protein
MGILLIISDGLATAFDHQKTLDEYPPSGVAGNILRENRQFTCPHGQKGE